MHHCTSELIFAQSAKLPATLVLRPAARPSVKPIAITDRGPLAMTVRLFTRGEFVENVRDQGRAMPNPKISEDLEGSRRLLERLADVDPKCIPTIIADQWSLGDAEARRAIEEAIDRLPKRKRLN